MNTKQNRFKFIGIVLTLTSLVSFGQVEYKPTRKSLSQYEVPEWYQDAKIGFFLSLGTSNSTWR